MFNEDIVIDESAFDDACMGFEALGTRLENLRKNILEMIETLEKGFDTPAGRKFVSSCKTNLLQPMEDQKHVLEHISTTLKESKSKYSSVFRKYEELNTAINQVDKI